MIAINNYGQEEYFHPPGFTGLDGAKYKLVRFSENELHINAVKEHMRQQAKAHGLAFPDGTIKPLTETLVNGKCSAVICIRTPKKQEEKEKAVALMTYTRDISNQGEINFLEDIVVSEEYRNQRIGTKCLSSFIIYTKWEGKDGFRLHTKSDNTFGIQLFNRFGNTVFKPLPPIMELPRECVTWPENVKSFGSKFEGLDRKEFTQTLDILMTQMNWSNTGLLHDISGGKIEGAEGLVCYDKANNVTGVALTCTGFSTIDCTTNTHINTIASNNLSEDIPRLIQAIKFRHKQAGRMGSALIDFRDNCHAVQNRLQTLAERSGAKSIQRAGSEMVAGALGGDAFKNNAYNIAVASLDLIEKNVFSDEAVVQRYVDPLPIPSGKRSSSHLQFQHT